MTYSPKMVNLDHMSSHFGAWLERAINERGITKYRLAKTIEVSAVQIGRIISGERAVTDGMLTKIAPTLGLTFADLKREALKDELGEQLDLAAEAAMEEASPEDAAKNVGVYLRRPDLTPEQRKAFYEKLRELADVVYENKDLWKD